MTLHTLPTAQPVAVQARLNCVFTQAARDAWGEAGLSPLAEGASEDSRITACIERHLQRLGYDPDSPSGLEYAAIYREQYAEACEIEQAMRLEHNAEAQREREEWLADWDRIPDSPESCADYDASYDANYALYCKEHGYHSGPNPEMHLRRRNPDGDENYARRYLARHKEAYPGHLETWRRYNESREKKAA